MSRSQRFERVSDAPGGWRALVLTDYQQRLLPVISWGVVRGKTVGLVEFTRGRDVALALATLWPGWAGYVPPGRTTDELTRKPPPLPPRDAVELGQVVGVVGDVALYDQLVDIIESVEWARRALTVFADDPTMFASMALARDREQLEAACGVALEQLKFQREQGVRRFDHALRKAQTSEAVWAQTRVGWDSVLRLEPPQQPGTSESSRPRGRGSSKRGGIET